MATVYEFNTPPIKNSTFTFYISLVSQSDTNIFQTSVTLAAGDVIVYKDGVLDGNIDTLPTEIGSTGILAVALSADEMNANSVVVKFTDAAGSEWQDALVEIKTVVATTVSDFDDTTDTILIADNGITAAKIATDAITSDELAASALTEIFTAVLTTALTESYATDGSAPTLAQILFQIWSMLAEKSVSSTTVTTKKLDGSTTAMTFTLNSATAPTSITRAS